MEIWSHEGNLYEVVSFYCLPEDAWRYELDGLSGAPGTGPHITVAIPDATPDDGPFTPEPARLAVVHVGGGETPWPVLRRFLDLVESSGDLVNNEASPTEDVELPSSNNVWWHDGQRFEVNSFHFGEHDAWCYELCEVKPEAEGNDYIEVRIPDASPDSGPFIPEAADRVTLTIHGSWTIPWPMFRRFIEAIKASGDIVGDPPEPDDPEPSTLAG
ncbi:hypothetical protein [Plantactinospora soyae]|uniref:Uncharacterized protein n=1 Tax=Plantactinospora soyae TaxID=1544732 RepID=A0A927M2I1_9ACTN|nr:hypothetical protein [Plantactinospora soyae]MBE1484373.1 hypothetical protein [Plantactinospora soyae]